MVRRPIRSSRRTMWYVYGVVAHKGRVLGGFSSENEAMNEANKVTDWDSDPQYFQLNTIDMTEAKKMIKYKLIERSNGSLRVATEKLYK